MHIDEQHEQIWTKRYLHCVMMSQCVGGLYANTLYSSTLYLHCQNVLFIFLKDIYIHK